MRDRILPCAEMWRVIKSIGRGLRSVRPSQCCPQDCSDDGPNQYHHHNHDEVSKAHGATLRYFSVASSWSPLTLKRNDICHEGITQACLNHFSHTKVISETIYTGSYAGSISKCHYQRCPPWHWKVLQENPVLEKGYSEEYRKQKKKQNTEDWGNTCHHQEWKEILHAYPTLHALGLGSAAALTWSLYYDWRKHHLFLYQAKNGQQQTPNGTSIKHNLNHKDVNNQDQKSEELFQKNHSLFNNLFYSETNSHTVSSNTHNDEYHKKDHFGETEIVCNSPSHSTSISKQGVTSAESQTHEPTIPVYSLQQKYLDVARKLFSAQGNWNVEEKHKILEEIYKDDFHDMNEPLISHKDEISYRTERKDSGCMSDLNKDFQSQTHSKNPDQYNKNGGSDANSSVLDTGLKRPVSLASELELPAKVKGGKGEHSQHTISQEEPVNSCIDVIKAKILHDMLIEIVKADREDEMSRVVGNGGKNLTDTKPEEEVLYFQAGVLIGDPSSAFNLALCYHMGHGIKMDLEKARKLYEAASAAGHGWATYNLAVMVSQGLGGPPLPQRARSLLQQAAKMGITEAVSVLEMEEEQQSVIYEDKEPQLHRCCSEPCLSSAHSKKWSSSGSSSDLQSLLDDDDWTVGDLCTYMDVSQKN